MGHHGEPLAHGGELLVLGWRTLKPYVAHVAPNLLDLKPFWRMLQLGLPIGAQMMLEGGAFNVMALLMGWLGVLQVAAHQIALNLASLTFMVPLVCRRRRPSLLGTRSAGVTPRCAALDRRVARVGAGFMLCTAALFILAPEPLAGLYTRDAW